MTLLPSALRLLPATALLLGLGVVLTGFAASSRSTAITPADFTNEPALIDPDAGAEIILTEISIDESAFGKTTAPEAYWTYLIRVRIIDERGVKRFSKIELPYDTHMAISRIEARTFKPDGSVVSLDRKDIFQRDVVKTSSSRQSVKSFAPPGLDPGVILEYSYTEERERMSPFWLLRFQRDLPARLVRYRLRPYSPPGSGLRSLSFNLPPTKLNRDSEGFYTFEAVNLKGWKNEPFQLPLLQLQPSAVVYFDGKDTRTSAERYWDNAAKSLHERTERVAKPSKAIHAALTTMVSAEDPADVKLRKIHEVLCSRFVNRDRDTSGFTREQRRKLPKNDDADDTVKRRVGTGDDLVIAFTALARAAGLDARLAMANDRTTLVYSEQLREPFVFTKLVAAVRTGDTWTYCDPAAAYLKAGTLDWKYTGTSILIGDPEHALMPKVSLTPANESVRQRTGTFTLDEQGTLSGRVTITQTGYFDAAVKNQYDALSPEERTKRLKEEVQKQFPLAELSDVTFEHAADPLQSLVCSYELRLPEFAERTGSRLFVQPSALQKGIPPLFDAPERRSPILFHHLYTELDAIEINVPPGSPLEAGSAPPPLDLGRFGSYATTIAYTERSGKLTYSRRFELHAPGAVPKFYPLIKEIFEGVHARDNHMLTFRPGSEATSPLAAIASAVQGGNRK